MKCKWKVGVYLEISFALFLFSQHVGEFIYIFANNKTNDFRIACSRMLLYRFAQLSAKRTVIQEIKGESILQLQVKILAVITW